MPYFTGTVSAVADIKTVIETACVSSGWSINSGWLNKGQSFVELSVWKDTSLIKGVRIRSANGPGTGINTAQHSITLRPADFPLTYEIFIHSNPDQVVAVFKYGEFNQVIMFGDLKKVHPSAYVGGNWVFASGIDPQYTTSDNDIVGFFTTSKLVYVSINANATNTLGTDYGLRLVPFPAGPTNSNSSKWFLSQVHAEIDNQVWLNANEGGASYQYQLTITPDNLRLWYSSLSTWNQQALLIPFEVSYFWRNPGGQELLMPLGLVDHIRLMRITNYNTGDVVTFGSDRWKVYPWYRKNTDYPNGTGGTNHQSTGTFGFAVKYDGP